MQRGKGKTVSKARKEPWLGCFVERKEGGRRRAIKEVYRA